MKNILAILKELGIDVPADKEAELNKQVAENYKTVAEHDKKVEKMQKDIDNATERANTAETTLKSFEGKDFEAMKAEAEKWKSQYDGLIQKQKDEAEKAELDEAIANAIKEAKGKNAKAIIAQLDMDAIKASKNRDKDIASAIKSLADAQDTAFLFETDPEATRAKFTESMAQPKNSTNGTVTKESIMAIKDRTERIQQIAQNKHLFQ